jgi:hypothetical protein
MIRSALAAAALASLAGCVAPVGPVEVTRFHVPDTARLGRQLTLVGYSEQVAGAGDQVALVRLRRQTYHPQRQGGPVSVGVGGSTGSYGSGVGLGIGIDLSGPPPDLVETELAVTIKDRVSGQSLWEGRASFVVSAKSPLANSQLGAAKMAEALFKGFPGRSGETIEVK